MATITKNPNYYGVLDNDFAKQLGGTTTVVSTAANPPDQQSNRRSQRHSVTQSPYATGGCLGKRGGGGPDKRRNTIDNQAHVQRSGVNQRITAERRAAGRDQEKGPAAAALAYTKRHEQMIANQAKEEENAKKDESFTSYDWGNDAKQLDEALKASESNGNQDSSTLTVGGTSNTGTLVGNTGNSNISNNSDTTITGNDFPIEETGGTTQANDVVNPPTGTSAVATNGGNNEAIEEAVVTGKVLPMIESKWILEIRPSNAIAEFNIEEILGGLIVAVTSIDSFAYIKSWNDAEAPHINTSAAIPQTDDEMAKYVEDPHTVNGGNHGKFFCRITIASSIPFEKIKYHQSFNRWVRHVGVFLDRSELETARPKSLGFFTYKLPHWSRTHFFAGFLKKLLNLSKPFQILTKPIYAEPINTKKTFAYSIQTASEDVDIITDEIKRLAANIHLKFYSWDDYKKTDVKIKHTLLDEMLGYRATNGIMLFEGLWSNELMREGSQPISKKRNSDKSQQTVTITKDQELDIKYGNVKCLDFLCDHFRHTDDSEIFIQIRGPVDNLIEVTYAESDKSTAIIVDRIFPSVLAAHMTDESIQKSFFYGDLIKASIGQHEPWVSICTGTSGTSSPFCFHEDF